MEPDSYNEYLANKYLWNLQPYVYEEVFESLDSFLSKYRVYDQTVELSIDKSLCLDIQDVLDRAERKYGPI